MKLKNWYINLLVKLASKTKSSWLLAKLAKHKNWQVREAVTYNENVKLKTLAMLEEDEDIGVCVAAKLTLAEYYYGE